MNDRIDTDLQDTAAIIEAFGGIRPMAHKLEVPVSTVQGWKQRDAIPSNRVADIVAAAAAHDIDLAGTSAAIDATENTISGTAPSDAATPEPTGQQGQNRSGSWLNNERSALFVAVIALVVAVGIGGWLLSGGGAERADTAPGVDLTQITGRLDALETTVQTNTSETAPTQFAADLAALRKQIDQVAAAQSGGGVPTETFEKLASRLQAAETKLVQVQRQTASDAKDAAAKLSAARDEIAQLRGQIAGLSETSTVAGKNEAGAVGLSLAAGRLQRAMDNGDAYEDVLATLRTFAAGDDAIGAILDRLAKRAATGVPSRDALAQAFPGVARNVVATADVDAANGWSDRTLQRIRNVVSIRPIGPDVSGDAPEARIARAEAKLFGGDVHGAVAELDGLTGAAASAAADWLGDARARLESDAAVDQLEALAIARLQARSGGS